MTRKEIVFKANEFGARLAEIKNELSNFSDDVSDYALELPYFWREDVRRVQQDAESIETYLRRALDRLAYDVNQLKESV